MFAGRRERLQAALRREGLEGVLITHPVNVSYLTKGSGGSAVTATAPITVGAGTSYANTAQGMINAINNAGQIVGSSRTVGDADTRAVIWTANGGITDLNLLIPANSGWDLQGANSISNNGKIAGAGIIKGHQHAFLLIPE